MNFAKVTHHSVNVTLEAEYQYVFEKIKVLIAERDKKQVLGLSFDKWTSADGKKFIGVYLYAEGKNNICLGLVHYVGRCGAEEICSHLKDTLKLYGLVPGPQGYKTNQVCE